MKKINTLITERFDFEVYNSLRADPRFSVTLSPFDKADPAFLQTVEALVIRSGTKINSSSLSSMPELKLIISCTSGFDHIDLEVCKNKNIIVTHTPSAHTQAAAELTWSLILSVVRKINLAHSQTLKGNWNREPLVGSELLNKKIGIVGVGRIGQKIAKFANAFDMNLFGFDPYQEDSVFESLNIKRVSFHELLLQSDIITFHVPKSKETTHMLRASNLEDLAHGVYLINTSRGEVIDPQIYMAGLTQGYIKGLGLDVHYKEPLDKETPYLKSQQGVFTPHVGATTQEALFRASQEAQEKLILYCDSKPMSDTLPPSALWWTNPMGFVDA